MLASNVTNSVPVQTTVAKPANQVAQADKTKFNEATVRSQSNVQILKASLEVSISAGNESQQLLFRSAIDKLNEILKPEFGDDAIQTALNQDNSPEGTAGRIVALSTGFFEAYAAQHPDKDQATAAKDFIDLIRGGFEKGFNEARDILKGLDVLGGDIEAGINKTYELVQKGYDSFLSRYTGEGDAAANEVKTS